MKHILVAIDFSETSLSAFYYASKLAESLTAKLTVIHVVSIPLVTEAGLMSASYSIPYSEAKTGMDYFINQAPAIHGIQIPKIKIDSVVETGVPVTTICSYAKENEVDLLIMGTIEKSSIFDRILGSTAKATINRVSIPVLLIHRNTRFLKTQKIIFGVDYSENLKPALEHFNTLNKHLMAFTDFIHIKSSADSEQKKEELLHEVSDRMNVQYSFEINEIDGDNPAQDIIDYCFYAKADMLALVHYDRNIFGRIWSSSTSFATASKIHIPVLIIPNSK